MDEKTDALQSRVARLVELLEQASGQKLTAFELYASALVHSSALQEHLAEKVEHNERLEFLGDAVLELAVTEWLFERFPYLPEGALSKYRSELVRTDTLAGVARRWDLGSLLLCGNSAKRQETPLPRVLAGAVEAVLGALFLETGYEPAKEAVWHLFATELALAAAGELFYDYKSRLQQECHALFGNPPEYVTLDELGPPHQPTFVVEVRANGYPCGRGAGPSRKQAEQEAARQALQRQEFRNADFSH